MTKTWRRFRNSEVSLVQWLTYRVGMDEIARKLDVDLKVGLKDQDAADERASDFGSNKRDLMKPKPCYQFLKEQLSDIMLIILIIAAVISLILNFATASPEEYSTGKCIRPSLARSAQTRPAWSVPGRPGAPAPVSFEK